MKTSHFEPIKFADFFCGAGGASEGIRQAGCEVVVAVNHDPDAIKAHRKNHPKTLHLNEDVREVDPALLMRLMLDAVWWSAECTHLSKAKGGTSRDADSRMLSEKLVIYARKCMWKYIFIENVTEFLTWGPLTPKRTAAKVGKKQLKLEADYIALQIDLMKAMIAEDTEEHDRIAARMDAVVNELDALDHYAREKGELVMVPAPGREGVMYKIWVEAMRQLGYRYEYRVMNAADYGLAQSRERYFAIFQRLDVDQPICWPTPTHSKNPEAATLFGPVLKKHRPCREILDLNDRGKSIFYERTGKPLVEATLRRIATGLKMFAKDGKAIMIDRYHTGATPTDANTSPMSTIMSTVEKSLVEVETIDTYTHNMPHVSADAPLPTVMAKRDKYRCIGYIVPTSFNNAPTALYSPLNTLVASRKHQYLCCAQFIAKDYTSKNKPESQINGLDGPLGTVTTGNHHNQVVGFLTSYYGTGTATSVDSPLGTVTTHDRCGLVRAICETYGSNGKPEANVKPLANPLGAITTCPHHYLMTGFLSYQYTGTNGHRRNTGLNQPINTICTSNPPRQILGYLLEYHGGHDASRRVRSLQSVLPAVATENYPGLINAEISDIGRFVLPNDAPYVLQHAPKDTRCIPAWCRIIGPYLVDNRIIDIYYRMLKVPELMKAQGFPDGYFLDVGDTKAKRFIGNAVPVDMAREIVKANFNTSGKGQSEGLAQVG